MRYFWQEQKLIAEYCPWEVACSKRAPCQKQQVSRKTYLRVVNCTIVNKRYKKELGLSSSFMTASGMKCLKFLSVIKIY